MNFKAVSLSLAAALLLSACGNIDRQTGQEMTRVNCDEALVKVDGPAPNALRGERLRPDSDYIVKAGYEVHDHGSGQFGNGMFCYRKAGV